MQLIGDCGLGSMTEAGPTFFSWIGSPTLSHSTCWGCGIAAVQRAEGQGKGSRSCAAGLAQFFLPAPLSPLLSSSAGEPRGREEREEASEVSRMER